jgi:glycosyltransferase involved in cell wall biosynthesis
VIHSHHPFLLGQAAVDKAKKLNVPMVFTFHTRYREYSHYVSLDQDTVKAVIHHWLGDYMRDCHHIIVPSNSIKQMLADEYGMDEQVTTLPTGINLAPYRAADSQSVREERGWGNDMVLISIGRLAKEKNWDTLIKAVAKVMQTHDDLRLVLIGEGEERKALQELARDLGVGDKVEFTGIVPYEEVPAHLKAANLFCFASVTETQGLVTMEAMAADLPVVAVEATGTSDVVESGRDGLLTENNANALAQAIARVIDHPDLMAQLREAAIQRAADFDMIRQAERLVAVYEQAAEDQKAGRTVPIPKSTKLIDAIVDGDSWLKVLGFDKDKWARA